MKKKWDKLGIVLSSACMVHCVLVALLPLLLPAVTELVSSPWVHFFFGILIVFTSPLAFIPGYRRHGLTWILIVAGVGLATVLMGLFLEGIIAEWQSHGLTFLGSILLVIAHMKNIRHSQHHHCC